MTNLDVLERLAKEAATRLACEKLKADSFGLQIWGESQKGGDTHVLDVRGWGYLTGRGHGALGLSGADGIAAQRAVQAYVVASWNALPDLISAARERDAMREALTRLASSEAFDLPQVIDGPLAKEMRMRMDFARQALNQEQPA